MSTLRYIGIDFGTSTTVVRVKTYVDGKPESSEHHTDSVKVEGNDTIPTVVLFDPDTQRYWCGPHAISKAQDIGISAIGNFKMDLVNDDIAIKQKAEDLTKQFFAFLYEQYHNESPLFTAPDEEFTIVSYPAKWENETPAQVIIDAAKDAGFKNVKGTPEPAAALNTVFVQQQSVFHELDNQVQEPICLLVDMGAGTTDLALCRYSLVDGSTEILDTWPKADSGIHLGGREIDTKLKSYVMSFLESNGLSKDIADNITDLAQAKAWKEQTVSPALNKDEIVKSASFTIGPLRMLGKSDATFPPLNREKFEQLLDRYLPQFPTLISEFLADSAISARDIQLVVLTGGHSQWYWVSDFLAGKPANSGDKIRIPAIANDAKNRIVKLARPQETVALGLVYGPLRARRLPAVPEQATSSVENIVEAGSQVVEGSDDNQSQFSNINETWLKKAEKVFLEGNNPTKYFTIMKEIGWGTLNVQVMPVAATRNESGGFGRGFLRGLGMAAGAGLAVGFGPLGIGPGIMLAKRSAQYLDKSRSENKSPSENRPGVPLEYTFVLENQGDGASAKIRIKASHAAGGFVVFLPYGHYRLSEPSLVSRHFELTPNTSQLATFRVSGNEIERLSALGTSDEELFMTSFGNITYPLWKK